jgi:hypothetical protein
MLSDQLILDLGIALQAQNHILKEIELSILEIDNSLKQSTAKLSTVAETSQQLIELELLMDDLEADQAWLEEEDFCDFNPDQILSLYQHRQQSVFRELTQIGFQDWDSFVCQCSAYALSQGVDPLAPYEAFLTAADLKTLEQESYSAQYQWDRADYLFVGASGILAALTDYLLVKIPKTLNTGEYAGQIGSPITEWIKSYRSTESNDWFAQWAEALSETCKVPYDRVKYVGSAERIAGMFPKSHRFQSLGHDPVLGFVFGVLDIMRGTLTGFSYDNLTHQHTWVQGVTDPNIEPIGLIEAMLRHIGHLISDVATPMGLPAPFMTLIQAINIGSFGEKKRTVGEVARWMYLSGYDLRHFIVSGITPAVIEIILRAYIILKHYSEHGETKFNLTAHPKYRSMLLMAHSIATLGNVGKVTLMQANPLAINSAEWMALVRYVLPSLQYWVFDQHKLRREHWEKLNSNEWEKLLNNSNKLMETTAKIGGSQIVLGAI